MIITLLSDSIVVKSLVKTLSNTLFWGTIIVACFTILIGFLFQRKKWLGEGWEKPLVKIILWVGLPALIIKNFMIDLNIDEFKNMVSLFILGILFYALLFFGSRLFFLKQDRNSQDAYSMAIAFPSTIYFGLPMARALAEGNFQLTEVDQAQNMFNVGYWIFMCSFAVFVFQRNNAEKPRVSLVGHGTWHPFKNFNIKKLRILFANPIIIALFVGFFLWIMQLIPGIKIIHVTDNGWNTISPGYYSITRLDALIPGFSQATTILGALPTPIAWLAVGAIIGKNNLRETFSKGEVWYASFLKMLVVPALITGLLAAVAAIGWKTGLYSVSNISLLTAILMIASPAASTIASYAITYNKGATTCSQICTQTTLLAIVTMPFWAVIASVLGEAKIFTQIPV
ncbi:hypothetical protein JN01_0114 [Entomoplasma freundtii]|uniref:Malate permease n=1 Tax=Entomoplasma freundtii TaxID=74700 RepID=A0A2K8NS36_9MOLU|nr:AEC family transporter [Entomoplasma freundtii]ATZ16665.1 malate permease [Entomoplasma freundtii]TDY58168.1 hypothetical protein JN01_0114 [Entomoplasma freundtii]